MGDSWIALVFVTFCAAFLLPRQFFVAFVQRPGPRSLETARWALPLYLFAINLPVPILVLGRPRSRGAGLTAGRLRSRRGAELARAPNARVPRRGLCGQCDDLRIVDRAERHGRQLSRSTLRTISGVPADSLGRISPIDDRRRRPRWPSDSLHASSDAFTGRHWSRLVRRGHPSASGLAWSAVLATGDAVRRAGRSDRGRDLLGPADRESIVRPGARRRLASMRFSDSPIRQREVRPSG